MLTFSPTAWQGARRYAATGSTLTTGGFFRFIYSYALDVINITDQIATAIHPAVYASAEEIWTVNMPAVAAGQYPGFRLVLVRVA